MSNSEVAQAIWPWRRCGRTAEDKPVRTRRRALIEAAIMVVAASILRFMFGKVWIPRVVLSLAGLVLVGGLFWPPLYFAFKKVMMGLGRLVGVGLAWLLLVPFFYICFTVARLLLALRGRDPMQRRFDKAASTYWSVHRPVGDPGSYGKQY